jgi:hypothetical protein
MVGDYRCHWSKDSGQFFEFLILIFGSLRRI